MYRILVPLDGTGRAARALPWAEWIATDLAADLYVARAVPVIDPARAPAGEYEEVRINDAHAYLDQLTAQIAAETELKPAGADVLLAQGAVGDELAAYAAVHEIDLVVMASHGRGGVLRAIAGSITGDIVRAVPRPVLVIGPAALDHPVEPLSTILVPLDNSEESQAILQPLAALAFHPGSRLILYRVVEWPPAVLPVQGALIPLTVRAAEAPREMTEDLEALARELRQMGAHVEVRVSFGDRAASIVDVARELEADMIAMSTHSLEGIGHWLVRSIAEEVIGEAPIPVLVYHPAPVTHVASAAPAAVTGAA